MLVNDFVNNFNKYWVSHYFHIISYVLTSRCTALAEIYNTGLPMYMTIDRKLVNDCDIQSSSDDISQLMMQLKLLKSGADEDRYMVEIIAWKEADS